VRFRCSFWRFSRAGLGHPVCEDQQDHRTNETADSDNRSEDNPFVVRPFPDEGPTQGFASREKYRGYDAYEKNDRACRKQQSSDSDRIQRMTLKSAHDPSGDVTTDWNLFRPQGFPFSSDFYPGSKGVSSPRARRLALLAFRLWHSRARTSVITVHLEPGAISSSGLILQLSCTPEPFGLTGPHGGVESDGMSRFNDWLGQTPRCWSPAGAPRRACTRWSSRPT
jgi:hypothetical protein